MAKIEAARAEGLPITADMYTYPASSTGLDATMPPWVEEGGHRAWMERLKDPAIRQRLAHEMPTPSDEWDSTYMSAGSPDKVLLVGFKSEALKPLSGKTLAQVAAIRGTSPEETVMDLVIEDDSDVGAVYFTMSEDNIRRQIALPWVSFGSDGASLATEGVFLEGHPPAGLWQLCPAAGQVRPRRRGDPLGGGGPAPDLPAGPEPQAAAAGSLAPGLPCRRRRL